LDGRGGADFFFNFCLRRQPCRVPAATATPVLIIGSSFGVRDSSPTARLANGYAHISAISATWTSDSSIGVVLPAALQAPKASTQSVVMKIRCNAEMELKYEYCGSWHGIQPMLGIADGSKVTVFGVFLRRDTYECIWNRTSGSICNQNARTDSCQMKRMNDTSTECLPQLSTAADFLDSNMLRCATPVWEEEGECDSLNGRLGCMSELPLSILANHFTYLAMAEGTQQYQLLSGVPHRLVAILVPCFQQDCMAYTEQQPVVISVVDEKRRTCWNQDIEVNVQVYIESITGWQKVSVFGTSIVTAKGTASFFGLLPQLSAGNYHLNFSANFSSNLTSPGIRSLLVSFNVTHGEGDRLRVVEQAMDARMGIAFEPHLTVEILDQDGGLVLNWKHPIVLSLSDEAGYGVCEEDGSVCSNPCNTSRFIHRASRCLSGALTTYAVRGRAVFTNVSLDGLAGLQIVRFVSGNLSALSEVIHVTAGIPTALSLTSTFNESIDMQNHPIYSCVDPLDTMHVRIFDAFGNMVPSNSTLVSAELSSVFEIHLRSHNPQLYGQTTVMSHQGSSKFEGLRVYQKGMRYFLTFRSPGLIQETSNVFVIWSGEPNSIFITQQPSDSVSEIVFASQPIVELRDACNNSVLDIPFVIQASIYSATASRCNTPHVVLQIKGTSLVTSKHGNSVFTDLSIGAAYRPLRLIFEACLKCYAFAVGNFSVLSTPFLIAHGEAVAIAVEQEPFNVSAGFTLWPAPVVRFVDSFGNIALAAFFPVTAMLLKRNYSDTNLPDLDKLSSNGYLWIKSPLQGNQSKQSVEGRTVFSDLSVLKAPHWYKLHFDTSDAGIKGVQSAPFYVNIGRAEKLVFKTQPSSHIAGSASEPPVEVCVADVGGNILMKPVLGVVHVTVIINSTNATANVSYLETWAPFAANRSECISKCNSCGTDMLLLYWERQNGSTAIAADPMCGVGKSAVVVSETFAGSCAKFSQLTGKCVGPYALQATSFNLTFENETVVPSPSIPDPALEQSLTTCFAPSPMSTFTITSTNALWLEWSDTFHVLVGNPHTVRIMTQPVGSNLPCQSSTSWRDSWGASCESYSVHPEWCGNEQSSGMCCVCGGGSGERIEAVAAQPLYTQPEVQILDVAGNVVCNYNGSVLATSSSSNKRNLTLVGNRQIKPNMFSGYCKHCDKDVVRFTDLAILEAESNVTLHFQLSDLSMAVVVDSTQLDIIKGNLSRVTVEKQPRSTSGGLPLKPQPEIWTRDAGGNHLMLKGSIIAALARVNGNSSEASRIAELLGNAAAHLEEGIAVFTDLALDVAGEVYVLEFRFVDAPINQIMDRMFQSTEANKAAGQVTTSPMWLREYPVLARSKPFLIGVGSAYKLATSLDSAQRSSQMFQIKAGMPFKNIELQVQDRGGNIAAGYAENASVALYRRVAFEHYFECRGVGSCSTNLKHFLPPADHVIVSASLNMHLVCTDFDYITEKIESISVGSAVVRGNLGPWPWCSGRCFETVQVLSEYDVSALVKDGDFAVQVVATKDVDLSPCDGDTVVLSISLTIVAAMPYSSQLQAELITGPQSFSFAGVHPLDGLSIVKVGLGSMLLFKSTTSLQAASIFWIEVLYGEPESLRVQQQPGNSTGGVPFILQPIVEVLDLGATLVKNASMSVCANLSFQEADRLAARSSLPVLLGRSQVEVVGGRAVFTDLAVDVAAVGYRFNFVCCVCGEGSAAARNLSTRVRSTPSEMFSILRGRPWSLLLNVQPISWAVAGKVFVRQPSVLALDAGGNMAYATYFVVTANIAVNGAVNGILGGSTSVATVLSDGFAVANFTDLSLDKVGAEYTLQFSSHLSQATALSVSAASSSIRIIAGAAAQLMVIRQPAANTAYAHLLVQPIVQVADLAGNVLATHCNVSASLVPASDLYADQSMGDSRLSGTTTVTAKAGRAFFFDLSPNIVGMGFQLNFSGYGLSSVVSEPFQAQLPSKATLFKGLLILDKVLLTSGLENSSLSLLSPYCRSSDWLKSSLCEVVRVVAEVFHVTFACVRISVFNSRQLLGWRRRLFTEEGLEVTFEVVLLSEQQQRQAQELASSNRYREALQAVFGTPEFRGANIASSILDMRVLELTTASAADDGSDEDPWSGFWSWNQSTPAGVIFRPQTSANHSGDIQMFVGSSSSSSDALSDFSCAGTVADLSMAHLLCYDASGRLFGALTLQRTLEPKNLNAATATLATRRKSAVETHVGAKILSGVLLLTSPSEQRTKVVAVSDTRKILAASVSLYQIERDTSSGLTSLSKAETLPNSDGVVALSHLSYFGTDYLMTVSHYSSELES
jgi:hypothetical protein